MSWWDTITGPGRMDPARGSPDFYTVNPDGSLTPGAWADGMSAADVAAVEARKDEALFTVDAGGRSRVLGVEAYGPRLPRLVLVAGLVALLLVVTK